jgi:hypothetical protein
MNGFKNQLLLFNKSRVYLLIYVLYTLKSLKLNINLILLKLKYLNKNTFALFNLYLYL